MSSSVLLAVGYSKFKEWPIACSRALLLGFDLYCVGKFVSNVGSEDIEKQAVQAYSSFSIL